MDEPLQLVSGVGGIHQQPEVFWSAEIHVEGHHPQTGLDLHRVEASVPENPEELQYQPSIN